MSNVAGGVRMEPLAAERGATTVVPLSRARSREVGTRSS